MNNHKRVAALLSAAMMLATTTNATSLQQVVSAESSTDVDVVVVPNSIMYKKDDESYLAKYGNGDQVLKFSAARNERESAQIMLHSDHDIKNILIEMSTMTNTKDSSQSISENNIEIYFEQYVPVKQEWWMQDLQGFHADPLLPYDIAIAKNVELNKLDPTYGGNQGIWFTLTVPDSVNAGTYTGTCSVKWKWDGVDEAVDVPVEITVYDFTLPDQTSARTYYNDTQTNPNHKSGYQGLAGFEKSSDYATDINSFLNERHISTGWPGADVPGNASQTDDLNAYAEAVFNYVTTAQAPYYNIEPKYVDTASDTPLKNVDFALTNDFSELVDDKTAVDAKIDAKFKEILSIFENEQMMNRPLTEDEISSLEFAVKTYLYFEVKYYTYTLDENEKNYISAYIDNPDYMKEVYLNKYLNIEKLNTPKETKGWIERLYDGLMLSGKTAALPLARLLDNVVRYCQYDWDNDGESKFGIQTILQALVDKSLEKNTDLLKYAVFKSSKIDEANPIDFWRNYRALVASKVLEDSKQAVKKYINKKQGDAALKARLADSLDNIRFLITESPATNKTKVYENGRFRMENATVYSTILNHGLQYLGLDAYTTDFQTFNVYLDGYGHCETTSYAVTIPKEYHVDCFCPKYNDFSDIPTPEQAWETVATDYDAAMDAVNDSNTHLWWYNCNEAAGNPVLPNYYIGGNKYHHEKYNHTEINGNSLAIVRANKWQQYKLGIEGEHHWAVDCYSDSDDKYLSNVWTDLSNAKYIEGLLVYPLYSLYTNTLGLSDAQANDELMQKYSDRFASSIRLENISESIDDYDYLCYANQLINKCRIIEDDLDESVDLDSYVAKINKIYDTLFDDVNYDDNVTSEKITKAKNDLAGIITSLQYLVRTKAFSFHVVKGDSDVLYIRWNDSKDKTRHFTEYISIDFKNCKSSVGTMTPSSTEHGSGYEVIIPLDDMPMMNTAASDSDFANMDWYGDYYMGDFPSGISVSLSYCGEYKTVDVVQPTKQNNYLKTEFWSQNFDESVKDWKTGGQCVSFEFKPIDLIADTEREKHTVTFCFYQETPWKRTTEYYSLNVVDGTAKIGDTTIQATDAGNSWYRLTVPFSILEPCETTAVNCSIDLISFRWINHSIAIRNVRICKEATGDLNGDGKMDRSDVLMLQGYLVSNGYMKLDLWKEADFDYNCELNAIDLALMTRAILNQR